MEQRKRYAKQQNIYYRYRHEHLHLLHVLLQETCNFGSVHSVLNWCLLLAVGKRRHKESEPCLISLNNESDIEQVGRITSLVMRSIHIPTGIYPRPFTNMTHFLLPLQHEHSPLYLTYISNVIFYIYFEINFSMKHILLTLQSNVFSDVSPNMSLHVMFRRKYNFSICAITNMQRMRAVS
jgi:hypothetical protein